LWYDDGDVHLGQHVNGKRAGLEMYVLQPDKSHSLFEIRKDEQGLEISRKLISSGHHLF
jgi:hypothetical protein